MKLAEYMKTLLILRAFIRAHVSSQIALTETFGEPTTSPEIARCILESQTEVYLADASKADYHDLVSLKMLREQFGIISGLIKFVESAGDTGLNVREIGTLTHPLEQRLHEFDIQLDRTLSGLGSETSTCLKMMHFFPTVNGEEKPLESTVQRILAWEGSEMSGGASKEPENRNASKECQSRQSSKAWEGSEMSGDTSKEPRNASKESREPSKEFRQASRQSSHQSSIGDTASIYSSSDVQSTPRA